MAHFARIVNNFVTEVVVVDDKDCSGGKFPDSEKSGQEFLKRLGLRGLWLQCSYNNNFRGWYPSGGWTYNKEHDVFVCPQPGKEYELDESTWQWVSTSGTRIPYKPTKHNIEKYTSGNS